MGEHKLPKQKPPLNIRIRVLATNELKGQPFLVVAMPTDMSNLTQVTQVAAVIEVMIADAHTLKTSWHEVSIGDFKDEESPRIQIAKPMTRQ